MKRSENPRLGAQMPWGMFRSAALALAMALPISASAAGGTSMHRIKETVIDAGTTLEATRYTSWIDMRRFRTALVKITLTHSAATSLSFTCKTADNDSGSNGDGFPVPILVASGTAGTSTITDHTWSQAVSADDYISFAVVPHDMFMQCAVANAGGGASDTILGEVVKSSP